MILNRILKGKRTVYTHVKSFNQDTVRLCILLSQVRTMSACLDTQGIFFRLQHIMVYGH